jgi:hypothetical protein
MVWITMPPNVARKIRMLTNFRMGLWWVPMVYDELVKIADPIPFSERFCKFWYL